MIEQARPRGLVIKFGRPEEPWWWKHVDRSSLGCDLDYRVIPLDGGRPATPFTASFLLLAAKTARLLVEARRSGYKYVFTLENDWLTFIVAGLQSLLWLRTPRHVILLFVMRERTPGLRSALKYAFMRACFSRVYRCICPSSHEVGHYANAFRWPREKLAFVPSPTDPAYLDRGQVSEEPVVLSAGRTFRDYATLLEAAEGIDVRVTVVAGRGSLAQNRVPDNVTVLYDLPSDALSDRISRCMIVVIALEDREISAGQSVLLEAMALGKAVIVTGVTGTIDYVENMSTGVVVSPNDSVGLREAMSLLIGDPELRRRFGAAARRQVRRQHLPDHYAQAVSRALARA